MKFPHSKRPIFVVDIEGVTFNEPTLKEMSDVLESLDEAEFSDQSEVWLSLPGDKTLSFSAAGVMTWEEDDEIEKILIGLNRAEALKIWQLAVAGKWREIDAYPWQIPD